MALFDPSRIINPILNKWCTIPVNNQLYTQFFFRIHLFQFSTYFEHPCAHHQENQLYCHCHRVIPLPPGNPTATG